MIDQLEESKLEIRPMKKEDIPAIVDVAVRGFANPDIIFEADEFANHIDVFPEGQLCVLYDGKVVGSCSSVILNYDQFGDAHTIDQVNPDGKLDHHDYNGDTLYGLDVVVDPNYRKLKIGKKLYEERRRICREYNLKRIIIGGRIPNYHKYADKYTAEQYVALVFQDEIFDPVIVFQRNNGFTLRHVQSKYLRGDTDSLEYAAIMEWKNDEYKA